MRWRWDNYQDTPPTREMAAASGKNPPDGAIIDYFVPKNGRSATLEITDSKGNLVRRFTSDVPPESKLLPQYSQLLVFSACRSLGRSGSPPLRLGFALRRSPHSSLQLLRKFDRLRRIHSRRSRHPRRISSLPAARPARRSRKYTVSLTVDGENLGKQPLNVVLDPRIHATQADLDLQVALAERILRGLAATTDNFWPVKTLADAIADRQKSLASAQNASDLVAALKSLAEQVQKIQEGTRTEAGIGPINRDLARVYTMIESGDLRPVETAQQSVNDSCKQIDADLAAWRALNASTNSPASGAAASVTLNSINTQLVTQNLAPLPIAIGISTGSVCGK